MDLDNVLHQADGNLPFAVTTNGNLTLNAGDTTFGFKKVQLCPTSTFANAEFDSLTGKMALVNSGVGYTTNSQLTLQNTNATAGNTTGVPAIETYKSGRNTVLNDVIMSQQFNANAYTGAKTTFAKIECSVTGASAPTGIDGALDFYTCINGANQNVFRLNGADNENNTFRPFDLNGNALKTSQGNLEINSTSSTGTGTITIAPKADQAVIIPAQVDPTSDFIKLFPSIPGIPHTTRILSQATDNATTWVSTIDILNQNIQPQIEIKADFGGVINKSLIFKTDGAGSSNNKIISYDGQTNLPLQIDTSGYANGSIEMKVNDTTGDLLFTGTNIQSGTSGGNSGQHLRIKLNGTYYKIALQDD
jgi:hypothetical protein